MLRPLPAFICIDISQCYIERERGGIASRFRPIYSLCLHAGDKFLLAGQKRSGNKTSNYIISMDKRDMGRDSAAFIGARTGCAHACEFAVADARSRAGEYYCCTRFCVVPFVWLLDQ